MVLEFCIIHQSMLANQKLQNQHLFEVKFYGFNRTGQQEDSTDDTQTLPVINHSLVKLR